MSYPSNILRDLCVACADATDVQMRGSAQRLLCHELAARLRSGSSDPNVLGTHPAYIDDAAPDFVTVVGVQRETRIGGIEPAVTYYAQPQVWDVADPQTPTGSYAAVFPAFLLDAQTLSSLVRETLGNAFVDAARYRVRSAATASITFGTQPIFTDLTTPSTITLTTGTWRVQYSGTVRSESTTPGALVGFQWLLDGTLTASQLVTRTPATAGDDIDVIMTFNSSDDIVVSGTKTLTMVNSTSSPEFLDGLIRIWQIA